MRVRRSVFTVFSICVLASAISARASESSAPAPARSSRDNAAQLRANVRKCEERVEKLNAAKAKLSQPFLSQIERGRARPSMPSLHRIAAALGTTAPQQTGQKRASPTSCQVGGLPLLGGGLCVHLGTHAGL